MTKNSSIFKSITNQIVILVFASMFMVNPVTLFHEYSENSCLEQMQELEKTGEKEKEVEKELDDLEDLSFEESNSNSKGILPTSNLPTQKSVNESLYKEIHSPPPQS